MGILRSFRRCSNGATAVIVAVVAPILLVCAGSAVDYGLHFNAKLRIQETMDGAALEAARIFIDRRNGSPDQLVTEIRKRIAARFSDEDGIDPNSLRVEVDSSERMVAINADAVTPTSFLLLAGIPDIVSALHSSAVAEIESQPVCILALDSDAGTGIEFSGQGEMKARDCVVWSNSGSMQSIVFGGNGKVSASMICAHGRVGSQGRFTVSPEPKSDCEIVKNPMAGWRPPDANTCDYRIEGWVTRTTAQLEPGVYCGGLRVDAKNIFMSPGIYIVKDGPLILRGSSKISGKAVGVFLRGEDARLDIDGKSQVELTAPRDGPMSGIVIASSDDAKNLSSSIAGRSDLKIGGVIYLPTHELNYWGESDTRAASPVTTIIANTIKIGGESYLEVKNDRSKAKYAPIVSTGADSVHLAD